MSVMAEPSQDGQAGIPPGLPGGVSPRLAGLWRGLFGSMLNSAITVATAALLAWAVPPLLRWLVFDATWSGTAQDCRASDGACWAFVAAKIRFILFAFYPPDLQWRPALATSC